jgi:hypothetical protein
MPQEWTALSEAFQVFEEVCTRKQLTPNRWLGDCDPKMMSVLNEWVEKGPFDKDDHLWKRLGADLMQQAKTLWFHTISPFTPDAQQGEIDSLKGKRFLATGRGGMAIFIVLMKWAYGSEMQKPIKKRDMNEWVGLVAGMTKILQALFKPKR